MVGPDKQDVDLPNRAIGKNGLVYFLFTIHASRRMDASCEYGQRKQDAAYILVSCPLFAELRTGLIAKTGTTNYRQILFTKRGIRAAARFIIATDLLPQFSLASQINKVAEDLIEKARYRPGKGGRRKNRLRQPYEPESIFYSRREAITDIAQRTKNKAITIIRPENT